MYWTEDELAALVDDKNIPGFVSVIYVDGKYLGQYRFTFLPRIGEIVSTSFTDADGQVGYTEYQVKRIEHVMWNALEISSTVLNVSLIRRAFYERED